MRPLSITPTRTALLAGIALLLALIPLGQAPVSAGGYPPQVARGVTVPAGFASRVFAQVPPGMLPTSLTWGRPADASVVPGGLGGDAGAAVEQHGVSLYVTVAVARVSENGDFPVAVDSGAVVTFPDEGYAPTTVAEDLSQPLGIVEGPDGSLFVAETIDARGQVTRLTDTDGDGYFETHETVIHNLPNGRHQTNGMDFGPDGMLYVANGNATDDGIDCGPAYTGGQETCPHPEIQPWSGSILRVNPDWRDVDLLSDVRMDADGFRAADGLDDDSVIVGWGFRNIYDVEFDPYTPDTIWTPMNGPDNPSGSEPLYAVDVDDTNAAGEEIIDDAGFPSCLYDAHFNTFPTPSIDSHSHDGVLEPENNPNPVVIEQYGECRGDEILRPEWIFGEGHEGTTGLAFTVEGNFPDRFAGDLFVGEWGSIWNLNGGQVTGHKLIHLDLDPETREVRSEREFMTGVLPMDVAFSAGGLMYVADMGGAIYEVRHVTDAATPEVVTIDIVNGQFVPAAVTVVQGQTVRWVNRDTSHHTVTAIQKVRPVDPLSGHPAIQSGEEMNSMHHLLPGQVHEFTFTDTATYVYHSAHAMNGGAVTRGSVVVAPHGR